ncbi:MAG: sigma-70 family RNA polymerase sigma factor [Bacteroidales bacterium]|jgi:RNA polymerase sigma-70 factor (ECF subfamily)|nr:sigma-70 family RNA polymerase sigma factor [Bacteroidales bacterium]
MNEDILIQQLRNEHSRNFAFRQLMQQEQEKVYRLIRRMVIDHDDTDDLVQSTFIKVFENINEFEGKSKLSTWIYRIAVNEALNFLRHKRRKLFVPIIDVERQLSNKIDTTSNFNGDEVEKKLQKAILTLPAKQRLVFNMRYYENIKYEEMSDILGTSVGALKASYHIAEEKIEKILKSN